MDGYLYFVLPGLEVHGTLFYSKLALVSNSY